MFSDIVGYLFLSLSFNLDLCRALVRELLTRLTTQSRSGCLFLFNDFLQSIDFTRCDDAASFVLLTHTRQLFVHKGSDENGNVKEK
jgi:hypothetical protein